MLGASCSAESECASGFCVDGVCCNTTCTGTCEACGSGTTGTPGTCAPITAGTDPDNECAADAAQCRSGTCNGSGACGTSANGTECRAASGACDSAETCQNGTCPADARLDAGVICRAAVGVCDEAESCDGVSISCPTDALKAVGVTCRASQGDCDPIEMCTGSSADCPADQYLTAGSVCRAATSVCDVPETCTGSAAACPLDTFADAGVVCRSVTGNCDAPEYCTGLSNACPADVYKNADTACGVENAYRCTGTSITCPTSCTTNAECMTDAGITCKDQRRCVNGKWAFLTTSLYAGNLGGLVGADSLCTAVATDAGLSGTYRAWLGDSTSGPLNRFTQSTRPYYNVTGLRIANNWADLTDGTLQNALFATEQGIAAGASAPWSSVFISGATVGAQNCSGWTTSANSGTAATAGRFAISPSSTDTWTFDNNSIGPCSVTHRLMCFQQ